VRNWDEVVNMVAVAADQAQPGEWIFGRGWHQDKWDSVPEDAVDGVPRNDTLNAVSPDNPVLLGHASGHAAFANDAALAAAGIGDDTEDPPGGTIVRTPEGKATGLLRETAQRLVNAEADKYTAQLTDEQQEALLRERVHLAGEEALRHGVTSFHDAGADFATIDFFRKLEAEGTLPVRLYVMVRRQSNDEMAELLPRYRMVAEGNDFLTVRSIKRQIDGALGAHGAWLLEPYDDLPSTARAGAGAGRGHRAHRRNRRAARLPGEHPCHRRPRQPRGAGSLRARLGAHSTSTARTCAGASSTPSTSTRTTCRASASSA
jgi:predicted amidohydrolase YtcJ